MKTYSRITIGALFFAMSMMMACKKNEQVSPPDYIQVLTNNDQFIDFVSRDIILQSAYKLSTVNVLKKMGVQNFTTELNSVTNESLLPGVLSKYGINYDRLQHYYLKRAESVITIRNAFPDIVALPNQLESDVFTKAYDLVSKRFIEKVEAKLKQFSARVKPDPISKPDQMPWNQLQQYHDGFDGSTNDTYGQIETMLTFDLTEEQQIDLLTNAINDHVEKHQITYAEFFGCLSAAVLGSLAEIKKIFDAAQAASTAALIQEMVAVGAKWILKHIGWIGAAVLIFNFSSCLYIAY